MIIHPGHYLSVVLFCVACGNQASTFSNDITTITETKDFISFCFFLTSKM